MTVAVSKSMVIYTGNGTTVQWDIPFAFLDKNDVYVYLLDSYGQMTLLTSGYQINTAQRVLIYPLENSGLPVLDNTHKLVLMRRTPCNQTTTFSAQAVIDPDVLESGYDKSILICQELAEEVSRCLKFPVGYNGAGTELEDFLDVVYANVSSVRAAASELSQTAESVSGSLSQAQAALQGCQNWASKTDGAVEGELYSAKYYASQAAQTLNGKADATLSNVASIDNSSAVATGLAGKADVTLSNVSQLDAASAVSTALAGKADTNASNFSNAGASTLAGLALPSTQYANLTLAASGASYTAPANGYVQFEATQTSSGGWIQLINTTSSIAAQAQTSYNNNSHKIFIPVKKNDEFTASYSNVSITLFKFIYAEGSKSEAN